jgi:hypothetical protein
VDEELISQRFENLPLTAVISRVFQQLLWIFSMSSADIRTGGISAVLYLFTRLITSTGR